jgi:hypothetical protein
LHVLQWRWMVPSTILTTSQLTHEAQSQANSSTMVLLLEK